MWLHEAELPLVRHRLYKISPFPISTSSNSLFSFRLSISFRFTSDPLSIKMELTDAIAIVFGILGGVFGLIVILIGYRTLRLSIISRGRSSESFAAFEWSPRRHERYCMLPLGPRLYLNSIDTREERLKRFLQPLEWLGTSIRNPSTLKRALQFKRLLRPKVALKHRRLEWVCASILDQILKKEKSDRDV
jgi:hypothetical protein